MLLPRRHRLSELIVREYHGESDLEVEWTLCKIQDKYWIVNARAIIKQIKHLCVTCKRLYATTLVQKMADLPPERCNPNEAPFTYVGVDLFGPFCVRQGRAEVKRYGCVDTCFTTRAIHIEKLNSLETDTFINGLVRFVARRGYPKRIRSDNGTNFVGAHAELTRELSRLNQNKVVAAAGRHGIDWVFNPPHASHQGGVWERQIRGLLHNLDDSRRGMAKPSLWRDFYDGDIIATATLIAIWRHPPPYGDTHRHMATPIAIWGQASQR